MLNARMLKGATVALAGAAFSLAAAATASAAEIVSVDGDEDSNALLGPLVANPGAAAGFRLNDDYENVSITIEFRCFFDCAGDIALFSGTDIGPGAEPSATIRVGEFDSTSTTIGIENISFLSSGDYFLAIGVNQGSISWRASSVPNVSTDGISENLNDLLVENLSLTSVVLSTFSAFDGFLHITITGDRVQNGDPMSEVPLPGAALFFIAGLGFLARFRKH